MIEARLDSGFTRLFEALMMVFPDMPVAVIAALQGQHDTRFLWRVIPQ